MQEAVELGLWKWLIEHVAIPLLGGLWAALAWWVQVIATKFDKIDSQHKADFSSLQHRLSEMDHNNAETYARRDDVKDGFARIEGKLDTLVEHALKGSQG